MIGKVLKLIEDEIEENELVNENKDANAVLSGGL